MSLKEMMSGMMAKKEKEESKMSGKFTEIDDATTISSLYNPSRGDVGSKIKYNGVVAIRVLYDKVAIVEANEFITALALAVAHRSDWFNANDFIEMFGEGGVFYNERILKGAYRAVEKKLRHKKSLPSDYVDCDFWEEVLSFGVMFDVYSQSGVPCGEVSLESVVDELYGSHIGRVVTECDLRDANIESLIIYINDRFDAYARCRFSILIAEKEKIIGEHKRNTVELSKIRDTIMMKDKRISLLEDEVFNLKAAIAKMHTVFGQDRGAD